MLRSTVLVATVVTAVVAPGLAACSRDRAAPRLRPMPKVDSATALRGGGGPRSTRIASYKIEARLDPVRHQVIGSETLTWTNTGETAVDTLPFHLYMNAFKNEQSLFMRSSHGSLRTATASETGWGWIQIDSVRIAGADLTSKLRVPAAAAPTKQPVPAPRAGQPNSVAGDETVVELPLAQPVEPGATIEVSFAFTDQLPEVFARSGYKGEFHMVGQWFPKIGVRVGPPGEERWECQPMQANTEFFADFGTYDVAITVPSTHTVAATGVMTNAVDAGHGTRTLTYHAEDVHDFVWMADPYMEVISGSARLAEGPPVEVRVYFRPEQRSFAHRHLEAGIGSIEKFSALFVPYPWAIMSIVDPPVDASDGAGGMEYPTLVTTEGDSVFARPGIRVPEYVTVHEIGHNWFQGLLASNEAREAWLDEGINEWADIRVMAEIYGPRASLVDWMGWQADMSLQSRAIGAANPHNPSPIATPAYSFVDTKAYGEATYAATARALDTLERTVGSQRFAAAMKAYAKAFAFRHPTSADFVGTLGTELGQDLSWFTGPVFHQVGSVELALRSAECRQAHPPRGVFGDGSAKKTVGEIEAPATGNWQCEVVVQNTGTIHVPVDIEFKFADGSLKQMQWDDRGATSWERFVVERSSRLIEVWIDPENKIEIGDPTARHYRLEGDGSASLRSAAWVGSLAQTLMQIVGP